MYMFSINNIFPKELFPRGLNPQEKDEEVPYDFFLGDYVQHLDDCERYYRENHPLPSLRLGSSPSSQRPVF